MSEIERLRDRVAELEDAMGVTAKFPDDLVPRSILNGKGRPMTLKLIGALMVRSFADRDALFSALYGERHEDEQPCLKIIDVYMTVARAALRSHGIELKTIWGKGWYLDAPDKTKLRAVIARLNEQRASA